MEKDNTGFFKTHYDPQRGWMLNNHPIKTPGGSEVKISASKNNITPGLQKVFTDTSNDAAKSMNDMERVVFRDILQKTGYYNRKPTKGHMSGLDSHIKYDLDNDVIKILNKILNLRVEELKKLSYPLTYLISIPYSKSY